MSVNNSLSSLEPRDKIPSQPTTCGQVTDCLSKVFNADNCSKFIRKVNDNALAILLGSITVIAVCLTLMHLPAVGTLFLTVSSVLAILSLICFVKRALSKEIKGKINDLSHQVNEKLNAEMNELINHQRQE